MLNKILLMSDLHFEFMRDFGKSFLDTKWPEHDICVIAGDLSNSSGIKQAIKDCCDTFNEVVYIVGNHEYYKSSFDNVQDILSGINCKNFHWLNNESKVVKKQRFIGGTLWFPDPINSRLKVHMNDYIVISKFEPRVYEEYEKFKDLVKKIEKDDIVISHHLPTKFSIAPEFKNSALNCFFLTDLSNEIEKYKPKLWCHGHTHTSCDYKFDNTRVVCNPLGYLGENTQFKYDLIL